MSFQDNCAVDTLVAKAILENLRQGTVPIEYVDYFSVGRREELHRAIERLEGLRSEGSLLTFVNGPYGAGKTHFLGLLRSEALRRRFCATHVVLSSTCCPLDRLQTVFGSLMKGLNTPDCRDRPAFRSILDSWIGMIREDLVESGKANQPCKHGLRYKDCGDGCLKELLMEQISDLEGLSGSFQIVLTSYINANLSQNHPVMHLCERWLLADHLGVHDRRIISKLARTKRQVKNIDNEIALRAFGDAARIVRSVNYRGLLVMLDEAETMPSAGRSAQIEAFFNLIRLMAWCRRWQNVHCVYATTPYFDSVFKNHLRDAEASDSIKEWINKEFRTSRIELTLPEDPMLLELALKVSNIYRCAIEDNAPPKQDRVKSLAEAIATKLRTGDTVRQFVTRFVAELDRM